MTLKPRMWLRSTGRTVTDFEPLLVLSSSMSRFEEVNRPVCGRWSKRAERFMATEALYLHANQSRWGELEPKARNTTLCRALAGAPFRALWSLGHCCCRAEDGRSAGVSSRRGLRRPEACPSPGQSGQVSGQTVAADVRDGRPRNDAHCVLFHTMYFLPTDKG